jgi:hypothetical protein
MQLFLSISAVKGMLITYANPTNAYQKSLPPTKQCYVNIKDIYTTAPTSTPRIELCLWGGLYKVIQKLAYSGKI